MADQIIEVPGQGRIAFPDSMNDVQIVAAIKNMSTPKNPAVWEKTAPIAALEYPMHLASSMIAKPVSEIAGLAAMAHDAITGQDNNPSGFKQEVQNSLTYAPRSAVGKTITESPLNPLNAIGKGIGWLSGKAHDLIGQGSGNDTAQGMAANAIGEAIPQGLGIAGAKYAPQIATGSQAVTNALVSPIEAMRTRAWGAIQPRLGQTGLDAATGRLANDVAGSKRADVIAALEAHQPSSIGVPTTAGEAALPANSAEFSALQKIGATANPSKYYGETGIQGQQEAARGAAIGTVAQDKTALNDAITARKTASDPLYEAARNAGPVVDSTPVISKIDDLLAKNPGNTELVLELKKVRKGLHDDAGVPRTDAGEVASVMDGLKKSIASEDNRFISGKLDSLKKDISAIIPGYQNAQSVFKQNSVPVNQIQIGQQLEKNLTNSLGTSERPTSFANAVVNEPLTIKRATGAPRFDELGKILDPKQMDVVNSIMESLGKQKSYNDLASHGMPAASKIVGVDVHEIPSLGLFHPGLSMARGLYNRLASGVSDKTIMNLSEKMADPQAMAKIMRDATPQQRSVIEAILTRRAMQGASATMPAQQQGGAQ